MRKRAKPAPVSVPVWKIVVTSLVLFGAMWVVFGQTLQHQFVIFDNTYVFRNPQVLHGLTTSGLKGVHAHGRGNWPRASDGGRNSVVIQGLESNMALYRSGSELRDVRK